MLSYLFLLLLLVTPASPHDSSAANADEEIIVTGSANQNRRVQNFVRALTPLSGSDPLARHDLDLCPAAIGLSEEHDAAITLRMRAVAAAANIKLAEGECKPNALVIFARDKNEMVASLRREHPSYFMSDARAVRIDPEEGPALAWHVQLMLDRDGLRVPFNTEARRYEVNTTRMSRMSSAIRPVYAMSVLILELDGVVGLSTTQVADYAAMRTFGAANPSRLPEAVPPTILTIMQAPMDAPIPVTMTEWDLAYLRGLYASEPYRVGSRQRSEIGQAVRRSVSSEVE